MNNQLVIYFKLLRVKQYIKNVFVFAPMFFVFHFSVNNLLNSIITFLLFCATASAVYIFNDLYDIEEDAIHPVKQKRPIVAGYIDKKIAIIFITLLVIKSLIFSLLFNTYIFYILISYILLNILYTLVLKRIPVIDIMIIGIGFVLRILAGCYATNITPSYWILLMTFLLAIFLGFSKRKGDLMLRESGHVIRVSAKYYSLKTINIIIYTITLLLCVAYIIYTITPEVKSRMNSNYVVITSVFVIAGLFRYLSLQNQKGGDANPTDLVISDKILQIIVLLWALSFIVLKYS